MKTSIDLIAPARNPRNTMSYIDEINGADRAAFDATRAAIDAARADAARKEQPAKAHGCEVGE